MDKIKLLTFSVIALLLMNIVALVYFFQSHSKEGHNGPDGQRPARIIIEKLQFDEKQQEEYQKLIHWHRSNVDQLDQQVRKTKQELYLQLVKPEVDSKAKDSLINNIVSIQKQIEEVHFKHFQDIKKLCTPKQQKDFDELTKELSKIFGHPKPRK